MKYDASGQKPASANGFDPGVEVRHIGGDRLGTGLVAETNVGAGLNEVRVDNGRTIERFFQTALTIVQPVANRRS